VRLLVIAAIVAIAAPARADDSLEEARQLEASLEYEQGLAMVERVIARGGASPEELAELHLLAGRLAAGLDRAPSAEDHFARLLALRPDAALPEGTSPKLTAPFDAARAHASPLRVSASFAGDAVALVTSDPLGMVVGIAVTLSGGTVVTEPRALRVVLPRGATPREVHALDADGNRVWIESVGVVVMPPPPVRTIHVATPSYARWQTWAIAGGVALVAGGISAWRFTVDQNQWNTLRAEDGQHDFSQLQALESRGRQWGLAADIGFGIAGAAAITAAIAYLTHRTVIVSGAAVSVAGRF
jgi:hypothetical protein